MRVLINGVEYDSEKTPIAIFLSDSDKRNISNMTEDAEVYCSYSDKLDNPTRDIFIDEAKELRSNSTNREQSS